MRSIGRIPQAQLFKRAPTLGNVDILAFNPDRYFV
jgi:hypothetical protein